MHELMRSESRRPDGNAGSTTSKTILGREELQTARQYNLDLLKAVAIVAMVFCHAVIRLSINRPGYEGEFLYFLGHTVLGEYLAVAHAFMFAMGVCVQYTRRNQPKDLIRRGVWIYLLGYVLNFFRYGIYTLGDGIISGTFREGTLYSLFSPDILQFAGLALIATGVFRKLKLRETWIFLIALALNAISAPLPFVDTGSYFPNLLLGHFITTTYETSCFAFCNWYLFMAAGLLFGAILRRTENLDRLYRRLLLISGGVAAAYLAATFLFGVHFLSREHYYYAVSIPEAAGLLSIDLCLLSAFHFLLKKVDRSKRSLFLEMSENMTPIYVIHWCILGMIDSLCCYLFELVFSWPVIYGIGFALLVASFFLARLWRRRKRTRGT